MDTLQSDFLAKKLFDAQPPCLSLYQRTHRSHPDNAGDPIQFGNLLKELEASLAQQYSSTTPSRCWRRCASWPMTTISGSTRPMAWFA